MVAHKGAVVMVLTELANSDDEKPRRGKQENGSKGGEKVGTSKTKAEDRMDFKDLFRTSVTDYEFLLSQTFDLVSPNERISGNRPILADERLALTLRYLATGESFQSLIYQFRISLVAVS